MNITDDDLARIARTNPDIIIPGYAHPRWRLGRPQPRPVMQAPAPTEAEDQAALFEWANRMAGQVPDLYYLHHIPNGGERPDRAAALLAIQGVKAGVPDIFLPCPRPRPDGGDWHGLYIELKRADHSNDTSPMQVTWIQALRKRGYMVCVCYGFDEAKAALETYLGL